MKKPIVVIDSSVLVVAAMSKRANYSIDLLNFAFDNKLEIIVSKETLQELKDVFTRPKFVGLLDTKEAKDLIKKYVSKATLVTLQSESLEKVKGYCSDPKDDIFLALADQVGADYLATLDSGDLLILKHWQEVVIVRPVVICQEIGLANL
jgi:putative PIN family toxin of toxin-antitoxin system